MKKSGYYLIGAAVLISFLNSSCSQVLRVYQAGSSNTEKQNDRFVFENDSIKVVYDFWNGDGLMLFAVQNKLDKALVIDWKKSHFSLNGMIYPYWRDVDRVKTVGKANTWGSGFGNNFWGFTAFNSTSVVSRDAEQTLISPNSWIERGDYPIVKTYVTQVEAKLESLKNQQAPAGEVRRVRKEFYDSAIITQVTKTADYTEENSPLTFRNYLTFNVNGENDITVDNSFAVTKVSTSVISKHSVKKKAYQQKSSTRFFSVEKNRHIIYPKNNLYIGSGILWSGKNKRGSLGLTNYSIAEIGYSRLIKNKLELGLSYTFCSQQVPTVSYQKDSFGHKATFRIAGYFPNKRPVRMSVGVNVFAGFYENVSNYVGYNYVSSFEVNNIQTIGGQLEIGLNLGARGFNVNPFFSVGVQNLSGSIVFYDGRDNSLIDYTSSIIGVGVRWRLQFRA